jgi:hypothetical protein
MEEEEMHPTPDEHAGHEEYSGRSASQLIRELLRLILVLIWRFLVWVFKRILKGILWCMQAIEDGAVRLNEWWHDNDTQEKVAKIKAWIKRAAKATGHALMVAAKATGRGIVIAAKATGHGLKVAAIATGHGIVRGTKATIQGIIHLRPTIKRIGRGIANSWRAFVAWLKRCRRGNKLSRIRRKRRHEAFRRNGGMKGWMTRTSHNMRSNIERFMEEDQEEADPDAVTEDDIMQEAIEEGANDGKRPMKIGKSIMTHAKNFMDVE